MKGPWRGKSEAARREAEHQAADEGQGLEDSHATEGVRKHGRRERLTARARPPPSPQTTINSIDLDVERLECSLVVEQNWLPLFVKLVGYLYCVVFISCCSSTSILRTSTTIEERREKGCIDHGGAFEAAPAAAVSFGDNF